MSLKVSKFRVVEVVGLVVRVLVVLGGLCQRDQGGHDGLRVMMVSGISVMA